MRIGPGSKIIFFYDKSSSKTTVSPDTEGGPPMSWSYFCFERGLLCIN